MNNVKNISDLYNVLYLLTLAHSFCYFLILCLALLSNHLRLVQLSSYTNFMGF